MAGEEELLPRHVPLGRYGRVLLAQVDQEGTVPRPESGPRRPERRDICCGPGTCRRHRLFLAEGYALRTRGDQDDPLAAMALQAEVGGTQKGRQGRQVQVQVVQGPLPRRGKLPVRVSVTSTKISILVDGLPVPKRESVNKRQIHSVFCENKFNNERFMIMFCTVRNKINPCLTEICGLI